GGSEGLRGGRVRHHGAGRPPLAAQLAHAGHVPVGGERLHRIPIPVPADHIERVHPDAAGGPEHCNADHESLPESIIPVAKSGAAAVTLSMRSSTPPCPGSSVPLSLTPATRFIALSRRSPTTEITTVNRLTDTNISIWLPRIPPAAAKATARFAPPARAPATPSCVLPGLMAGASLRRPKRRPVKKAAVSAVHMRTRRYSTALPPAPSCRATRAAQAGTRTTSPMADRSAGGPGRGSRACIMSQAGAASQHTVATAARARAISATYAATPAAATSST